MTRCSCCVATVAWRVALPRGRARQATARGRAQAMIHQDERPRLRAPPKSCAAQRGAPPS
eukprot:8035300-Pyramimonas_sp.AAC.1